ncbi:hypothetical protein DW779_06930 [Clostridium sp. AM30-24]|nr:hypothetical protein [Clostridium sp. AM30-24]RHT42855.1 hypothetical protein DW779_06930 [Clostridium sp. AM30-24]
MAVNYGQVAIVPKGVWNAETQYKVNNLVEYDGSSYVAKVQPPVGTLPTDTSYWQVSAAGTKKATADSLGTVMSDGTTTEIKEDGKLSAKTAQQNALGVVKGSDDITVGEDGNLSVNTTFEQATEIANIIAGEAIKSVLGKVSKAIATTMSLDENALLKNMISGIDVNDGNKVPSSAYIHTLVNRIGMGTELSEFDNLTAAVNSVNNNLSKYNFNLGNTTANNHKNIDRIATFSGGTWVSKDYNADFGGQWCLVDSFLINDNGAMQRIMSTQTNTVLATRYCEKNVWGDWDIGVTKSDLDLKLNKGVTFVGTGEDFGQAIKNAGIVELNRVGFFVCNSPSNSPLGNGLVILAHNSAFWNKHPIYIKTDGTNNILHGTLNCSDYTNIKKD